jgi:hypothetical protein
MREVFYLSDVAIPFLCPNADFHCFLHEPGGDDDCIDGSLCRTGRHDCLASARKRVIVKGNELGCQRAFKLSFRELPKIMERVT